MVVADWAKRRLRRWLGVDSLSTDVSSLEHRISSVCDLVGEHTTVNVDISPIGYDPSRIVVIGRYRNTDIVQVFDVTGQKSAQIVEQLKGFSRYARKGIIDAPFSMRAVVDRELEETK